MTCETQQCLKKTKSRYQGLSELISQLLQRHPLMGVVSHYIAAWLRKLEIFD